MPVTTAVTVQGMTCDHCASAVRSELGVLAGVTGVAVDLGTGAVTITSDAALDATAVAAAVDEAGYQVVP